VSERLAELTVTNVHAGYQDGIDVLRGVDLTTKDAGITAIIGPNGAGKSTLLRAMFGFLAPTLGSVVFNGEDVTGFAPHVLKSKGMSYIAQGITIFPHLTVEENLRMGAWTFRGDRSRVKRRLEAAYELFPVLRDVRWRQASELSGGQAKMVSVAKEIMTEPDILLVDEPSAGLSPALSASVYEFLTKTQRVTGSSIVLVDQDVESAVGIADHVYLLNLGKVRNEGPREAFGRDQVWRLMQECLTG
jgi:ABC-type branched-subunit amino acid transport system ATPase component